MKYISLFAGIGGFDLALNRLGHECVYVNEWDKYAAQTYEKNFCSITSGEKRQADYGNKSSSMCSSGKIQRSFSTGNPRVDTRSITDVPAESIPEHDLLVGGFPCQSFSVAGKRKGFDDTRGTLFFEIARILRDKRPRHFLLENVKGLLSHESGKTFSTILGVLTDLGYEYQWQVLNSRNFGVPQNRERVFIVGHLRGEPRPQIFPLTEVNPKGLVELTTNASQGYRLYSPSGISATLASQAGGIGAKTGLYNVIPTIRATEYKHGDNQTLAQRIPLKFLNRNQKNITGDYAYTIDGANTGGIMQDMKIRRLTPIECERLQGFPDNFTEGVSDTQRYKQLGNAVTVNVIYEIMKRFKNE